MPAKCPRQLGSVPLSAGDARILTIGWPRAANLSEYRARDNALILEGRRRGHGPRRQSLKGISTMSKKTPIRNRKQRGATNASPPVEAKINHVSILTEGRIVS